MSHDVGVIDKRKTATKINLHNFQKIINPLLMELKNNFCEKKNAIKGK
jgi:hypothetical protein